MKKEYYERLQNKLADAYGVCVNKMENDVAIILSKRELEDLHFLWSYEATKIWAIEEESPCIKSANNLEDSDGQK